MQSEQTTDIEKVRAQLSPVYWIGGASGAGKSTIARRIASRSTLELYATDDVMGDHGGRTDSDQSPYLHEFIAMDMDERWLNRSPETMLDTFHWFRGEGFELIIEDLVGLPQQSGTVAEGFRLLPSLVKPLLADLSHAVWLLPTPEFREAAFRSRGSLWQIAGKTSDPPKALNNLLARERMFTDRLREETSQLGLWTIELEVSMTEDDLDAQVTQIFGL